MEVRLEAGSSHADFGTVTAWLRSEADVVTEGEPLLEVEFDKVVQEIAAPVSGTLREVLVVAGDEVPIGTVLAIIETAPR